MRKRLTQGVSQAAQRLAGAPSRTPTHPREERNEIGT
jgi:hypothetical protein